MRRYLAMGFNHEALIFFHTYSFFVSSVHASCEECSGARSRLAFTIALRGVHLISILRIKSTTQYFGLTRQSLKRGSETWRILPPPYASSISMGMEEVVLIPLIVVAELPDP
ncbi:hypothetical protein HAX54_037574 [Datura stramonium]|uniref:Uncharacterized protein n=1 Tax=Datura stramonium TaxID=4076 RepID=A0ABS8VJU4_DATST|nr:hypothetical protein [Datura stramonium]